MNAKDCKWRDLLRANASAWGALSPKILLLVQKSRETFVELSFFSGCPPAVRQLHRTACCIGTHFTALISAFETEYTVPSKWPRKIRRLAQRRYVMSNCFCLLEHAFVCGATMHDCFFHCFSRPWTCCCGRRRVETVKHLLCR